MRICTIRIEMENDAFVDDHGGAVELADRLMDLSAWLEDNDIGDLASKPIQDSNGNTVGLLTIGEEVSRCH